MVDATGAFNTGRDLEKQGLIDEALRHYSEAVRLAPEFAQAHFNMGNLLLDLDRVSDALNAYIAAVKYKRDSSGVHYNMALAYMRLGDFESASESCRTAIRLKPDFIDAHLTHGSAQLEMGLATLSINSFDLALSLMPDCVQALQDKGIALQQLGLQSEASECYLRALTINPNMAIVRSNLASSFNELGLFTEAIRHYRIALEVMPDSADLHYNLGVALHASGDTNEAITSYRRAIAVGPDHGASYGNLASLLATKSQYEEALQLHRKAVLHQPSKATAHLNLGITLLTTGNIANAIQCLRRSVDLDPKSAEANLALGSALKDAGEFGDALIYINRSLELDPDYILAHSVLLFVRNYTAAEDTQRALKNTLRFNELADRLAHPYKEWKCLKIPGKRLRIGFVSGDLCDHPVGYFSESVFTTLSLFHSQQLELLSYHTRDSNDLTSSRIKAVCSKSIFVGNLSDAALAELIYGDEIDILIDLSGHSAHNRLSAFAWHAAPVQATWLGYFATTGLKSIDYLIADPWTLPPDQEVEFTERIVRLPHTRLCFTQPNVGISTNSLPALANGFITFGSFNNLSKIGDDVIMLWSSVLHNIPDSRLFLKTKQLDDLTIRNRTIQRFAHYGISESRLLLEGYECRGDYFSAYHKVDISLDTFPYPGGTTTVESLWMGVPVLTLAGNQFLSRQGVGLLMNAGLPDWIAINKDEYISRAKFHSENIQKLSLIRSSLRDQVVCSNLFDSKSFAIHFEDCLRNMWLNWCQS